MASNAQQLLFRILGDTTKAQKDTLAFRKTTLQLEESTKKADAALKKYGADSIQYRKAVLQAETAQQKLNRAQKAGEKVTKNYGAAMTAAGATIAGAGILIGKAFGHATKTTSEYGKEVIQIQRLTGQSAEESSKFASILGRYNVTGRQAAVIVKSLNNAIATQSKELKRIGVATKNADGSFRTHMEVLTDLAEKYKTADDKTMVLQAATKTLGRGFATLLPVLAGGAAGIDKLTKSAKENGLILNEVEVKAVKAYNVALKENEQALKGVEIQVGLATLPYETFKAEAIGGTFKALRDLNPELAKFAGATGGVAADIAAVTGSFVTFIGMATLAMPTIVKMTKAFTTMAGPLVSAKAGLMGVYGAVAYLNAEFQRFTTERLARQMSRLLEKTGLNTDAARKLGRMWAWVQQGPMGISNFAITRAVDNLRGKVNDLRTATEAAVRAIERLKGKAGNFSAGSGKGSGGGGGGAGFAEGGVAMGPMSGYNVKLHGIELITPLMTPATPRVQGASNFGPITINVNGAASPQATAAAVRAELASIVRRSGQLSV